MLQLTKTQLSIGFTYEPTTSLPPKNNAKALLRGELLGYSHEFA